MALVTVLLCIIIGYAAATQAADAGHAIRIIYTNDTIGYLEPCGCGGSYQGGLARRATLIARLIKEHPNTLIVDSGNLSDTAAKLPLVAKLMAYMHYDAIGIGGADSGFGDAYFRAVGACGLQIVDASAHGSAKAKPFVIKNIGGVRLGVVSCGDDDKPNARRAFLNAYQQARARSDVLILLDQGGVATKEWIEGDAARLGPPDIVIAGANNSIMPREEAVGKTHIMPTSVKGKLVGVVDLQVTHGQPLSVSSRMEVVHRAIPADQAAQDQIRKFLSSSAQASASIESVPQVLRVANETKYSNAKTCETCHPSEYRDWLKTGHAKAVQTLKSKDRLIPECLQCHSEEYRRTRRAPVGVAGPAGVECATCHASVLPHGADGPPRTSDRKVGLSVCISCHATDRSPRFDQQSYMRAVSHSVTFHAR